MRRRKRNNLSEKVKIRDGHKCQVCNSPKELEAHHLFAQNIYPQLIRDLDNMITLCHKCHLSFHRFCPGGVNKGEDFVRFLDDLYENHQHASARGLKKRLKPTIEVLSQRVQRTNSKTLSQDKNQKRIKKGESCLLTKLQPLAELDLQQLEPSYRLQVLISNEQKELLCQYSNEFKYSQLHQIKKRFRQLLSMGLIEDEGR
ncbi:HNH endonuclease [Seinonella peptonophila]|uniref:HNH endonuclease n=1 Tax=Seinonella peptonophila TaxID=112248 RepID=A0A1M5A024_9BACL|nr:HNH endonuclease [Seinonella peptonophila]SHF23457.1 HNH endonuclease [Seinonella peptonophila]